MLSCTRPVAFSQAVPATGSVTFPRTPLGQASVPCRPPTSWARAPPPCDHLSGIPATQHALCGRAGGPTGPQMTDLTITVGDTYHTGVERQSGIPQPQLLWPRRSCQHPARRWQQRWHRDGRHDGPHRLHCQRHRDTSVTQRYSITVAPPAASVWAMVDDSGAPGTDIVTAMGKTMRLTWGSSYVSSINVVCTGAKPACLDWRRPAPMRPSSMPASWARPTA